MVFIMVLKIFLMFSSFIMVLRFFFEHFGCIFVFFLKAVLMLFLATFE